MKARRLVINGKFLTQSITGVQRVGIEFCCALDELLSDPSYAGLEVKLAVPRQARLVVDLHLSKIEIVRVGWLSGHMWEQFSLPFYARRGKFLNLANIAPIASLALRSKHTYVMVHDLSYRYFPDAYSRTFRTVYNLIIPIVFLRAATVFTVAEAERRAILQSIGRIVKPDRLIAVQNGGASVVYGRSNRSTRGRNCLYVGSLTKRKNAAKLIESAVILVRRHNATFTFVGANGNSFEDVDISIPGDVASRIRFLGQIDNPTVLSAAYDSAAVLVFPSYYEASPLPPIEAMAHGCPTVVSKIPSLEERCGDSAVYCNPDDVDSIVSSVTLLLDSEEVWSKYQRRGLERSSKFSWKSQASAIIEAVMSTR